MKDGAEYAEMLGLTVSSCDVVVKPAKKRRKPAVKEEVVYKINEEEETWEFFNQKGGELCLICLIRIFH